MRIGQAQVWRDGIVIAAVDSLGAADVGDRSAQRYMRTFAAAFADGEALQQPAAQLPWGHLMVLLDRVVDQDARAHRPAAADRGRAPNNFADALPPGESDFAREVVQDPYELDFLALDPGHTERQLEDALVARLTTFLTELDAGFAFVGRQHPGRSSAYHDLWRRKGLRSR